MSYRCLLASIVVAAVLGAAPVANAATTTCTEPTGSAEFQRVAPETVDLDAAKLRSAVRFWASRLSRSVRVYRHGCLAATSNRDASSERRRENVFSVTKGVTALLTGLAITQGRLRLDDPIGRVLPEADAAHGAITVRQLLTQTSGLRFAWLSDVAAGDSVRFALSLPFRHAPGTYFEYAQSTVNLLAAVVQRAVGEDLQGYAQRELFTPIGIPRADWRWARDRAGNTFGMSNLFMPSKHLGRFGQLMLREGRWGDRQLIAPAYIREMGAATPTNGGYGFLTWTNAGGWMITPTLPSRRVVRQPFLSAAPADTHALLGFLGQFVIVIPSLDTVIVRTGLPGNRNPDLHALLASKEGDMDYEGMRRLMQSITDVEIPDPGRFARVDRFEWFDIGRFLDPRTLKLALFPRGCNLLRCR